MDETPAAEPAHLGERLRSIRRARGLTLEQVAAASGLTKGFVSQLERGLSSVSLSSLARLCAALDVRFGDVLDEAPGDVVVGPDATRPWSVIGGHEDRLLSATDERRLSVMESRIPPGVGAGDEPYTFPADVEVAYVLAGTLELRVGEDVYVLESGRALTYSPRAPHTWRNPSEEDAVVLWITVPNPFAREGRP